MKKRLRTLLISVFVLGLLTAVALAGASWWLLRQVGPDFWVEQLEKNTNCRVHVDDAKLSVTSRPARLSFHGVKIGPRDSEVGKPLAQRVPMAEGVAPIVISEIILEMKLEDLMEKRIFVEQFRVINPVISEVLDEKGKSSLEPLFKKPKEEKEKDKASVTTVAEPGKEKKTVVHSKDGMAYAVSKASIEKGSLTIQSSSTTVKISDLNFNLSGIDINPNDLANHNRILAKLSTQIQVDGMARIGGVKRPAQLANLKLSGDSDIKPINAAGQWQPYSLLKLTVDKGSVIAGHITMGDAAGKEMKKLLEYGIDLTPVRVGGPLLEPVVVDGAFSQNIFSLLADTKFAFPDYEVVIAKKAYVNAAIDKHKIELQLHCGPDLQTRLLEGVTKAKLGDSVSRGVAKALADEKGRMTFDIESEGKLSDPEIKPNPERLLKNLLQGDGVNDLLNGLLKKL